MADRLGRAVLELTTDLGAYAAGLDEAEARLEAARGTAQKVGQSFKDVGASLSEVGSNLTTWVTGPILGATAAMTGLVMAQASAGDAIAKNAREAGLSAGSYQELAFALGQVSQLTEQELTRGFASLTSAIADAASGSERHQQILQGLGFSLVEISSGSITTEAAFQRLTQALQSTDTHAAALKLASELLGDRVGRRLAGALRESGDQVDVLRQQFQELGLAWSDGELAQVEAFNDAMDVLKHQFGALGRGIAVEMMPILLNDFLPFLRDSAIPALKALAAEVVDAIRWFTALPASTQVAMVGLTAFAAVFGPLLMALGQLITLTGTLIAALPKLTVAIKGVWAAITGPLGLVAGALALSEKLYRVGDAAREAESWFDRLKGAVVRNLTPWGQFREHLDRVRSGWQWFRGGEGVTESTAAVANLGTAARKTASEVQTMATSLDAVPAASATAATGLGKVTAKAQELVTVLRRLPGGSRGAPSATMGDLVGHLVPGAALGTTLSGYGPDLMDKFRQPSVKAPETLVGPGVRESFWGSVFGTPQQAGELLSGTVLKAFQGGGNVAQSLGGTLGGMLAAPIGKTFSAVGSMMVGKVASTTFAALGSAVPVLGTLAGGALGSLVGKLFGPSKGAIAGKEADAQIKSMQQELLATYGSLDGIRKAGGAAGAALADAWGSKNVAGLQHFTHLTKQFTAAVEDNKRAHDEANPSLSAITDAAQRYGLSLDALGPKVQQLRIDEAAGQIVQDFQVLTAAGADAGVIIEAMGGELQSLVNHARKTGAALPVALRPLLEHMVEAGKLTDDAGNKMEGLESLTFAETLDEKIGDLVDTMRDLIDVIRDGVGGALDAIGNRVVEPTVRFRYEAGDFPEAPLPPGVVPMASGGIGRVTRPTLFLAGEAGPEDVAFSGANRFFGGGGPTSQRIQVFLDRRVLIDETMRGMAQQFQVHAIGAR